MRRLYETASFNINSERLWQAKQPSDEHCSGKNQLSHFCLGKNCLRHEEAGEEDLFQPVFKLYKGEWQRNKERSWSNREEKGEGRSTRATSARELSHREAGEGCCCILLSLSKVTDNLAAALKL